MNTSGINNLKRKSGGNNNENSKGDSLNNELENYKQTFKKVKMILKDTEMEYKAKIHVLSAMFEGEDCEHSDKMQQELGKLENPFSESK